MRGGESGGLRGGSDVDTRTDNQSSFSRNLQPYRSPGIVLIYPTVPCPGGGQVTNELTVTTSTEFEGWPCQTATYKAHTTDSPLDGSCRTGYCFYVSDPVTLNIQVRDSNDYSYLLTTQLLPGFNFLSWCRESVLAQGEGNLAQPMRSTNPEFSLLLCCNGMALTFQPVNPDDPSSPYTTSPDLLPLAYQLRKHDYPPSLTVLSDVGSVPSLLLLAKVAGGGRGLLFGRLTGLALG